MTTILDDIFNYYSDIAREIECFFGKEVTINCLKFYKKKPLSFVVSMEIVIPRLKSEDDCGLVLSTEAQATFGAKLEGDSGNQLFLISDISYGDGMIIKTTNEISLKLFDDNSAIEALESVRLFLADKTELIKNELVRHYGLKSR